MYSQMTMAYTTLSKALLSTVKVFAVWNDFRFTFMNYTLQICLDVCLQLLKTKILAHLVITEILC